MTPALLTPAFFKPPDLNFKHKLKLGTPNVAVFFYYYYLFNLGGTFFAAWRCFDSLTICMCLQCL